jgi:hypothetical protein
MTAAQPALENRPSVDDPTGADRTADIVLGAAVLAMGLVAGLYFFSAIAVMPALTAADDRTLVDAMQQMIDKIENPPFFLGARPARTHRATGAAISHDATGCRRGV